MWRRWGTAQNFFLAFIDELEKQVIVKKTVKVGHKKQIILIFTMLHLKKQQQKTPVDIIIKISMIWSAVLEI